MKAFLARVGVGPSAIRPIIAFAAAVCLLAPGVVSPAEVSSVPVVTKISGTVTLQQQHGEAHDLLSVELVNGSAGITTGEKSFASVGLDGAGNVRIGPSSRTSVTSENGRLALSPGSALLCAQADSNRLSILVNGVELTAPRTALFDLGTEENQDAIVAVFRGDLMANGKTSVDTPPGHAITIGTDGKVSNVPIESVIARFAPLDCPAQEVIASVMPAPSRGAGGGGVLVLLAALGGLAALVAHGGNNASTGATIQAPPTQPAPTPTPTPTPTPNGAGPPPPLPTLTPTPLPTLTPTPTPTHTPHTPKPTERP